MNAAKVLLLFLVAMPAIAQEIKDSVRVVVPVAGSVLGANEVRWRTALELTNDGQSEATVAITMMAVPDQPAMLTTIGPGDTVRFADVAPEAFGIESLLSPIVVETLGHRSVGVRATAYGMRGDKVFKPEPIAITYDALWYPLRVLHGLSFNDAFRTNIGFVNLGETAATFVVAAQRLPGRNLAIARVPLPPNSIWHTPIQFLFPLITQGDDFSLLIETSNRDTYVYASVIDNETNAATFVQPQVGTP